MTEKQTVWTRLTDFARKLHKLPILHRSVRWRLITSRFHHWCWAGMRRPWFTGERWVELVAA
jgi:hypothetical protein